MSKVFIIIPARYGSKRFPGKPLALICNKPMIQHVYERACRCKEVDDVYVATDDERVFSCVKEFGGKAVMTSKDHRSGTDRIYEAAKILDLEEDDIVVNVQGDQPTFEPSVIPSLIEPLKNSDIPMSTLMYPIRNRRDIENPNCVKVVIDKDGFAIYFSRSPIPYSRDKEYVSYYKHIGIYAYRMGFLEVFSHLPESRLERIERLEQLRAIENGYKIKIIESRFNSLEVDVPEDIERVSKIICP